MVTFHTPINPVLPPPFSASSGPAADTSRSEFTNQLQGYEGVTAQCHNCQRFPTPPLTLPETLLIAKDRRQLERPLHNQMAVVHSLLRGIYPPLPQFPISTAIPILTTPIVAARDPTRNAQIFGSRLPHLQFHARFEVRHFLRPSPPPQHSTLFHGATL